MSRLWSTVYSEGWESGISIGGCMMTRREFGKRAGFSFGTLWLALASGTSAFFMSGCGVFQDIIDWEPVGLFSFNAVVTLLQGAGLVNPVMNPLIVAVRAAMADLLKDAQNYVSTTPPPSGVLQKLEIALTDIISNIKDILSQIAVSNPILSLVTSLVMILVSALESFLNQVQTKMGNRKMARPPLTLKISNQTITVVPKKRTLSQYKTEWNSSVDAAGHPELEQK
jgi:hypothetical protein